MLFPKAGNEMCFLGVNVISFPPFPVCGNDGTIIATKKKSIDIELETKFFVVLNE